ncbi:MAG TPA: anthranilate phosphoribosyltransferase [Acidimicrobiales bacterium]|nr:anthranilate phosphoribosyltransferase [Acidimicrobiales bacterium]
MTLADLGGWPAVLEALTRGEHLTLGQTTAAATEILEGRATSAQVAAFAIGLRIKGETVEEMAALLDVMLDVGRKVDLAPGTDAVDTCGTGGDRSCTINASTVAALVVAGAGAKVCKHGNRSQTSECGSADLLEALGVVVDLGPEAVAACVAEAGMGFCFAPSYHPAFRHVGPTRRELGVPTVFNFLGPVANPGRVRRQVLGVSDPAMGAKLVGVLRAHGSERALVVYGHDGLDELSTITTSTVIELRDGEVGSYEVDPRALGLKPATLGDIQGGDPTTNAGLARRVLDGEPGPKRDFILLNAAAGLVAAGVAGDLAEGLLAAAASIDDGRAAAVLDRLVAVSAAQPVSSES